MIVKLRELAEIIADNKKFYLLYGINSEQIEETIENMIKPKLSKNIFNYDEDEIINNTDTFKESVLNKSLFDDNKLIIINRGTDKILDIIKDLIVRKTTEVTIVIKSKFLEKKSKLRLFFEKEDKTVCVPFYEDNYQSLLQISKKFFFKNEIKISLENINYIIERSKNNRAHLKNELEKVKIFFLRKKIIKIEDIVKLTNSAENYDISELIDNCLLKNKKKTLNMLNENIFENDNNLIILRSLLFKLKRLKKIKNETKVSKLEEVLSSFRPAIFWKDKDKIKNQLQIFSLSNIESLIKKINLLEVKIKCYPNLSKMIINNFIFKKFTISNN